MQRLLVALTLIASAGCSEAQDGPLIALEDWQPVDRLDDPAPHATPPASAEPCRPGGIALEAGALEINTGRCRYALVGLPLRRALPAGARVRAVLSHGKLASTGTVNGEPASGHVVLALAGQPLLDRSVAIPSDERIYDEVLSIPAAVPANEQLVLHLHNHGANNWRLHLFEEELQ